jgi:hypothetical protein
MTATALQAPVILAPYAGAVPTGAVTTSVGSAVVFTFNAAGDKCAVIFQSPGTTVPDQVSFEVATATVAGTTGDIEATLETISAGEPSGTPITNSATGTATISTTGVKTISGMDGTATVAAGDKIAIVLTAGAGWDRTLTIKMTHGASQGGLGFPYHATQDSGGAWAKVGGQNLGIAWGLASAAGTYINVPGLLGAYTAAFQSFSNATNPDERGNRWVPNVPQTIIGVSIIYNGGASPGANDDYGVALYSGHTGTPSLLASKTFEGEEPSPAPHICLFDTAVDLSAGTTYAVTFKAMGSDSAQLVRWDFASNAHLGSFLGTDFYATTRDGGAGAPSTGGSSFTDDSAKAYAVFPIFSRFDDGAGGVGGGGSQRVIGG